MFSRGLILGGQECLCATSQKRHLMRVILFTVDYCLFANGDVSIRFYGEIDNVVLESFISYLVVTRYFFNLHYAVNLQLRLRAKTKANPERGRAKSELGWAKSEQGRAKSEQGRASWKFHIEY